MANGDARTFSLSVVTPEGSAFDGEAERLVVPGAAGEIGVLARHAPLVAMLRVHRDRAIVLVDDAVRAEEIDAEQARREADEARALLERADAGEEGIDRWQAEQRLRHAENKVAVAGR
jgi:F-type H+-transporting ATPase subunit epsilon